MTLEWRDAMSHVSNLLAVCFALLATLTTTITTPAHQPGAPSENKKVHVGMFDSRAIAVSYYRSSEFNKIMKELHAEHKKAKVAGNDKLANDYEASGKALNELAHDQGFGTASVDTILKKFKDQLPAIAKANNVQVMVSQWNLAYQEQDAKFVDVTDQLVKLFHPDEATLKVILELRKSPVVHGNSH
jgi:hypothetical protein